MPLVGISKTSTKVSSNYPGEPGGPGGPGEPGEPGGPGEPGALGGPHQTWSSADFTTQGLSSHRYILKSIKPHIL